MTFCRKVLAKHWPAVPKYGDITQLTGNELEPVQIPEWIGRRIAASRDDKRGL